MKNILLMVATGVGLFVATMFGLLAAQGRLNYEGTKSIPVLNSLFSKPPEDPNKDPKADGKDAKMKLKLGGSREMVAALGGILPMMLMSSGHFAMLERLLDEEILRMARRKALLDPLSIAVPYYYLLTKQNEIMNLRLIANGIMSGLQKNAIRAALVFGDR